MRLSAPTSSVRVLENNVLAADGTTFVSSAGRIMFHLAKAMRSIPPYASQTGKPYLAVPSQNAG